MNDGTIITDKILSCAKEEALTIISEANAKALEIKEKADKTISDIYDKAKAEAADEAEKIRSKELSSANMAAGKDLLSKKQQLIDEVIDEAYKKLITMEESEYTEIVLNMLKSAPKGVIILSAKDKAVLGGKIKESGYEVSEETRDIDSGFVIKNGDIEHNFSFTSILTVDKEEIRSMVAEMLFK